MAVAFSLDGASSEAFYKQLILEDSQGASCFKSIHVYSYWSLKGNKKDFTYFALCRGVQIMGATLTVERNAELEQCLVLTRPPSLPQAVSGARRVIGILLPPPPAVSQVPRRLQTQAWQLRA